MTENLDRAKALQGKICAQVNGLDISIWNLSEIKSLTKRLDTWLNAKDGEDKEGAAEALWEKFWISDEDFEPGDLKALFELVTEFLALGVDTEDLEEVTMTVNSDD